MVYEYEQKSNLRKLLQTLLIFIYWWQNSACVSFKCGRASDVKSERGVCAHMWDSMIEQVEAFTASFLSLFFGVSSIDARCTQSPSCRRRSRPSCHSNFTQNRQVFAEGLPEGIFLLIMTCLIHDFLLTTEISQWWVRAAHVIGNKIYLSLNWFPEHCHFVLFTFYLQ